MYLVAILLALLVVQPLLAQHETFSQEARPTVEIKEGFNRKKVIEALHLIFEDPATGAKPTSAYQIFLKYQENRARIVKKMNETDDPSERMILNNELRALDRDHMLFGGGPKIEQALGIIGTAEFELFKEGKGFERIEAEFPEAYEKFIKEREAMVEELKVADTQAKKLFIAQKLTRHDDSFKIKYLGFLLGLTPKEKKELQR